MTEKDKQAMIKEFDELCWHRIAHYDNLGFLAFALYKMPLKSLAPLVIAVAEKRGGKGNLIANLYRYIFQLKLSEPDLNKVDKWLVENNIADLNILYNDMQDFNVILGTLFNSVYNTDESLWKFNKKKTMSGGNIDSNTIINTGANHHNIGFAQIQNLANMDGDQVSSSDCLLLIYERGSALVLAREANFAIIKDYYDFEDIKKNHWLISNKKTGLYNIMKKPQYVMELHWDALDSCSTCDHEEHDKRICEKCGCNAYKVKNPFMAEIVRLKNYWQEKKTAMLKKRLLERDSKLF